MKFLLYIVKSSLLKELTVWVFLGLGIVKKGVKWVGSIDIKNVTLPLQHQELWSRILPQIGKCHFKHQILSESNKNCKVLQNSQKKGTHEVLGHFNTIWPNFNLPTTKWELLATTVTKTSNLRSGPMDGLKIPPKGSTSNFKSNRHRLTLHQLLNAGENHQCRHLSNKAHG